MSREIRDGRVRRAGRVWKGRALRAIRVIRGIKVGREKEHRVLKGRTRAYRALKEIKATRVTRDGRACWGRPVLRVFQDQTERMEYRVRKD